MYKTSDWFRITTSLPVSLEFRSAPVLHVFVSVNDVNARSFPHVCKFPLPGIITGRLSSGVGLHGIHVRSGSLSALVIIILSRTLRVGFGKRVERKRTRSYPRNFEVLIQFVQICISKKNWRYIEPYGCLCFIDWGFLPKDHRLKISAYGSQTEDFCIWTTDWGFLPMDHRLGISAYGSQTGDFCLRITDWGFLPKDHRLGISA